MSTENDQIFDTIKRFMDTIGRKDYDAALPYVAENCEYTNSPMGTVTGPQGVRDVLEPFFAPTIENEFVWKHTAVDGDVAFVERVDRHLLEDGWVELPVTGVFRVEDGKITMWRDYFDLATIMNKWPQPDQTG